MSYKETIYDYMDKTNTPYEEFKRACYERAEQEPDVDYAFDGLSDENEFHRLYTEGKSVASVVYLMCM